MKKLSALQTLRTWFLALLGLVTSYPLFAQCSYGPELTFTTYTLVAGQAGQVGAVYRFPSVLDGVDALVTIADAENASLDDLDLTNTGSYNAFQPQVHINRQRNRGDEGYMDFMIAFVLAGTTTPTTITSWRATAVDVDGDDYRLRESVGLYLMNYYVLESFTELNSRFAGDMFIFDCRSTANQPGVTVTATAHMVTAEYQGRSSFLYRTRIIADPANRASEAAGRMFSLNFNPCLIDNYQVPASFPVELTRFEGRATGDQVSLSWTTATELNNAYFAVERSADGETFAAIGQVAGQGNSDQAVDYHFDDLMPLGGSSYYRLRQVDFDGRFQYSPVIEVEAPAPAYSLRTYPNPSSGLLTLQVRHDWTVERIDLLDLHGRQLPLSLTPLQPQAWQLDLGHLPSGTYFLRLSTPEGVHTQQIQVQTVR